MHGVHVYNVTPKHKNRWDVASPGGGATLSRRSAQVQAGEKNRPRATLFSHATSYPFAGGGSTWATGLAFSLALVEGDSLPPATVGFVGTLAC